MKYFIIILIAGTMVFGSCKKEPCYECPGTVYGRMVKFCEGDTGYDDAKSSPNCNEI